MLNVKLTSSSVNFRSIGKHRSVFVLFLSHFSFVVLKTPKPEPIVYRTTVVVNFQLYHESNAFCQSKLNGNVCIKCIYLSPSKTM